MREVEEVEEEEEELTEVEEGVLPTRIERRLEVSVEEEVKPERGIDNRFLGEVAIEY